MLYVITTLLQSLSPKLSNIMTQSKLIKQKGFTLYSSLTERSSPRFCNWHCTLDL